MTNDKVELWTRDEVIGLLEYRRDEAIAQIENGSAGTEHRSVDWWKGVKEGLQYAIDRLNETVGG